MSIHVTCPQCGKSYNVGEKLLGQHVKCAQCGGEFVVQTGGPSNASDPLFADSAYRGAAHPNAVKGTSNDGQSAPQGAVSGGPTDQQMRLGAALVIPIVIIGMLLAFVALRDVSTGAMFIVALGPLVICYGIAALIDPNIVRAAGKFGTHLPTRYKMIALAVGLVGLAGGLPLVFLILWR